MVPAGNTPQPFKWTPGISTGRLKVITVLRFHSSAFTTETDIVANATRQTAVAVFVNSLNASLLNSNSCESLFAEAEIDPGGGLTEHEEGTREAKLGLEHECRGTEAILRGECAVFQAK
jgi:hypothetical protein